MAVQSRKIIDLVEFDRIQYPLKSIVVVPVPFSPQMMLGRDEVDVVIGPIYIISHNKTEHTYINMCGRYCLGRGSRNTLAWYIGYVPYDAHYQSVAAVSLCFFSAALNNAKMPLLYDEKYNIRGFD